MPVILGAKAQSGFGDPFGLLSDCHRRIEMFLGVLVKAAGLGQSGLEESSRESLRRALDYFRDAAPRHTADEEESLFPRLRECDRPEAAAALDLLGALEHDHARADELHRKLDALGRRWLERPLESGELSEFGEIARELREMYARHIALEDQQVFPAARKALDGPAVAGIGREMEARRKSGVSA